MTFCNNSKQLIKERLRTAQALSTTAEIKGENRGDCRHSVLVESAPDFSGINDYPPLQIVYGFHSTPFGNALIAQTSGKICYLDFCDDAGASVLTGLRTHWPEATLLEDHQAIAMTAGRIFQPDNEQSTQPLTLYLKGSDFQRKVWLALLQIPRGQVTSYHQIAQIIDRPKAARAVGHAIGCNPICYLIPCHRVVRSDGSIGGYRSGIPRKRILLASEIGYREDAVVLP